MCRICRENDSYLPSLESLLSGLECLSLYYIFYTYFLKCVIGNDKWKKIVREWDGTQPFVSAQTEAFAMVMLKNNYTAWVEIAKAHGGVVTEYEIAHEKEPSHKQHVVRVLLRNTIIDVGSDNEEYDYVLIPQNKNYATASTCLNGEIEHNLTVAKENTYYENREDVTVQQDVSSRKRSYRQLREYTSGMEEDEDGIVHKFKGWSRKVEKQLHIYINDLKMQKKKRLKFHIAYRHLMQRDITKTAKKFEASDESKIESVWECTDEE